jgi:hypothetical protein
MGENYKLPFNNRKVAQHYRRKWAADLLYINWKHILKIWRERCSEVHGSNKEEIGENKKKRYLEEIGYLQSINQNMLHSSNDWILDDIEDLQNYNSTKLQTWLYGAKIISNTNQRCIKQQIDMNRQQQIWHTGLSAPRDEQLEKGDLDFRRVIPVQILDCRGGHI